MTPERWRQVEEMLGVALSRGESERAAFLGHACAGDLALRREVELLLAQQASMGGFLEDQALATAAPMVSDNSATMLTGRRLGAYEVRERIGVGGMGEVYRARDTKLGRDVAIKILPRHFISDPDRLARFEREARVLASLNHPHIGAIYGVEDAEGVRALVLELVEGETLAERIKRATTSKGPGLPVTEALSIARQITDALDVAHEKGIVHRDLKPANIKITPDGVVKVLDFGLAKAGGAGAAADLTHSPTLTVGGTQEGVILGTPAYMSPEQARGQVVDKRTDIWAFGCVLYEMMTGRRAFASETVSDTIAKILEREPDWTALPPSTPHSVRRLLICCLDKDPTRRFRDIADARLLLEFDSESTQLAGPTQRYFGVRFGMAALAAITALAVFAAAISILRPRASLPPWATDATTLSIDIPRSTTLEQSTPAISTDGRQVAWVASSSDGRTRIWLEALGTGVPNELPGTDGGIQPFWSPDGRSIGYLVGGQLKRIEVSTGTTSTITTLPDVSAGATWSAENVVVFAARYGIFAVPASGGTPTQVATLNREMQENQLLFPQFLPDNRHFLYVARSGRSGQSGAYVGSLDGTSTRLFSTTSLVRYAPPGYLLSVRDDALVTQSFNPTTLAVGVEATTIVQQVRAQGALNARFDVSQSGVLGLFAQRTASDQLLRWFDRAGNSLGDLTPTASYTHFRIGPGGTRVVADRGGDDPTGGRSVWVYEDAGGPPARVTFGGIDEWHPLWSPDATRVAFMSYRDGPGDIYVKSLVTSAPEDPLIADEEQKVPSDWSPDGRFLAYFTDRTDSRTDVWVLPVAPKAAPIPVARTAFAEQRPRFSPDGRFIAYESDETGQMEVYVQPFPPTGAKWQVSVNGGMEPKWRDQELLFTDPARMVFAVPVTTSGSTFRAGQALPLFKIPTRNGAATGFEVTPDGRRLLVRMVLPPTAQPMMIVLNWMARLKQ